MFLGYNPNHVLALAILLFVLALIAWIVRMRLKDAAGDDWYSDN